MNSYQFLCILFKMIKEEDKEALLEYAKGSKHFQGMSFQTLLEGRYNEFAFASSLSRPQQLLLYSYGYLYYSVKDEKFLMVYESKWANAFQIDDELKFAIRSRFTKERIQYLATYCEKKNRSILSLVVEPSEFVERFMKEGVMNALAQEKSKEERKKLAKKVILSGLKMEEYEHPEDRKLTENLRGNKLLEMPVKLFVEYDIERFITVQYTGSNIKVTPDNLPMIYHAVKTACTILDVEKMPDIYIQQGLAVNACTTGIENPILILNAGCLSLLDYEELLFIVGHEIGHIKSQHLMYQMISQAFPYIAEIAAQMTLGVAGIVGSGVQLLLYNWQRKAELTADRAGLLVCQSQSAAIRALMKCAGYPPKFYDQMNEKDFLKQVEEFENLDEASFNKLVKIICVLTKTHPWTVLRAKELNKWYTDGSYEKIIKREQ